MAKVTAMTPGPKKPTFNPNVNYKWEPTDVFEVTGQQLASLYHCLTREINEPSGSSIALKYEAFNTIMDIFKRGVEQGVIIEMSAPINEADVDELHENVNKLFKVDRDLNKFPHHHNHPNG